MRGFSFSFFGESRGDFRSDKRGPGAQLGRGSVPAKMGPKGAYRVFPHTGLPLLNFESAPSVTSKEHVSRQEDVSDVVDH